MAVRWNSREAALDERGVMERPAFTDDLVVLVKRVRAGERAVLPGTN